MSYVENNFLPERKIPFLSFLIFNGLEELAGFSNFPNDKKHTVNWKKIEKIFILCESKKRTYGNDYLTINFGFDLKVRNCQSQNREFELYFCRKLEFL